MLATATGNCDVTNVTYNENKYYVVTWTVYLDVPVTAPTLVTTSDRCCVPHLLVDSVAVQCQSLTSFITQTSKPSLDLFPHKCTHVEVIGLRIMVLWSIGFITNRHRIPPQQISLCPLLLGPDQSHYNQSRRWSRLHTKLAQITRIAPSEYTL